MRIADNRADNCEVVMEMQVSFPSEGEPVLGVLHLPDSTPAPGIIMCHGFTGHKAEAHRLFVGAARDFCRHGLAVLRFDFRGSGDSAGEFREMTLSREITDARTALGFLASRPEVDADRLGVLGLSFGGCVAACLAGRDERVRALVLWAAVANTKRVLDTFAAEWGDGDTCDRQGWELGRGFMDDLAGVRPLDEVRGYTGPSLAVHGANDEAVPSSDSSDYRLALGGRCQLHVIEGADHVFSSLPWKSKAVAISREFFSQALAPGG
jgi:dienelactone hydrolase